MSLNQFTALYHLCRYITRPAVANDKPDIGTYRCQLLRTERLILNRAGQVVFTLKTPYRDGTTYIVMSPLEFMQRLAALVPHPRFHLIRSVPPWTGRQRPCAWLSERAGQHN